MLHLLAQAAASDPTANLDWRHALLAALVPLIGLAVQWFNASGRKILEAKLTSAGHPQAAQTIELLAQRYGSIATLAEKQELSRLAAEAGIDHPAIDAAAK